MVQHPSFLKSDFFTNRQTLLLRVACVFWIIIKIACYKVWLIDDRLYPVVPALDFLDALPPVVHTLTYYATLLGLVLLIIFPRKKTIVIGVILLVCFSCLQDVIRLQPWEYQFVFVLIVYAININNNGQFYRALLFILISTYFFGGLHKFNGGFLSTTWDRMILKDIVGLTPEFIKIARLHYMGLVIPVIEIACGLGLLFFKNKKPVVLLALGMHLVIIMMLICRGVGFLSDVLPWNIAMMLYLVILFYKNSISNVVPLLWQHKNKVAVVCWGILPFFSFVGLWDTYLSSSLYAGKTKRVIVCIENAEAVPQLSPYFSKSDKAAFCNGQAKLALHFWALNELRVVPYPEMWYYKKFIRKWNIMYPNTHPTFTLYYYPNHRLILPD